MAPSGEALIAGAQAAAAVHVDPRRGAKDRD